MANSPNLNLNLRNSSESATSYDDWIDSLTGTDPSSNMMKIDIAYGNKQDNTNNLTAETTIDDTDTIPFYDASATTNRKSTWTNIKSVLKTYFDTLYTTASGVLSVALTGLSTATNAAITASDTILSAFGKLQAQMNSKPSSVNYTRVPWYGLDSSASANTITLTVDSSYTSYVDGSIFIVKLANTNTSSTVNININSLGNIGVVKEYSTVPSVGTLTINTQYAFQYNATANKFRILAGDYDAYRFNGQLASYYATSGANSNITSLTGLTTALSIAQGGTDATSASAGLANLGGSPRTLEIVTVSSSTSLSSTHNGKYILCTNSSSINITVPSGLGAGFNCTIGRWGAGAVNIVASSTTLNGATTTLILGDQYKALVSIIAVQSNVFSVAGLLA